MTEVERRLSAWQPSGQGLDADALLFAAGRAAARGGVARFAWPALTVVLTMALLALGLSLAFERSERLALARQLRETLAVPLAAPLPSANDLVVESPTLEEPAPDSYLASHRALEKGLDAWPIRTAAHRDPADSPFPSSSILRLGQRDALLDP